MPKLPFPIPTHQPCMSAQRPSTFSHFTHYVKEYWNSSKSRTQYSFAQRQRKYLNQTNHYQISQMIKIYTWALCHSTTYHSKQSHLSSRACIFVTVFSTPQSRNPAPNLHAHVNHSSKPWHLILTHRYIFPSHDSVVLSILRFGLVRGIKWK